MAKIRWSDIEGQQVSQFFLGEMYQFEYETFEADKYYDAFPVIFVLRRNQKNRTTGDKYIDGVNFHYYDLPRRIELFRSMARFFTNKIEYIRWSQSWLLLALSELICMENKTHEKNN